MECALSVQTTPTMMQGFVSYVMVIVVRALQISTGLIQKEFVLNAVRIAKVVVRMVALNVTLVSQTSQVVYVQSVAVDQELTVRD